MTDITIRDMLAQIRSFDRQTMTTVKKIQSVDNKLYRLTARAYMYGKSKLITDVQLRRWQVNRYYRRLNGNLLKNVRVERHNTHVMKWLLENKTKLGFWFGVETSCINRLIKYNSICIDGWALIPYKKSDKHAKTVESMPEYGRRYSYCGTSLQALNKRFRVLLTHGIYFESDAVNCHPGLLSQILEKEGIECQFIKEYRNNRETHLLDVMTQNNIDRAMAKDIFISVMLSDEHGSEPYNNLANKTPFLINLKKEFTKAQDIIVSRSPILFEELKQTLADRHNKKMKYYLENLDTAKKPRKKSAKSSVTSYYLHNVEDKILQVSEEFYVKNKIITNNEVSLIFDGMLIKMENWDLWHKKTKSLKKLIKKITGFEVDFKGKEMKLDEELPILKNQDLVNAMSNTAAISELESVMPRFEKRRKIFKKMAYMYTPLADDEIEADLVISETSLPSFGNWLEQNKTLMIRSPMGSCKTLQTYDYFRQIPEDYRVLIISFRRTLNKKYHLDLHKAPYNFQIYDELKGSTWDSSKYPRLIVQVNSLWKVRGEYDIVLLDEISYTLDILIDYSDQKAWNVQALQTYILNCSKLIVLDAYLTIANIEYVKQIRGDDECLVVLNQKKRKIGDVMMMQYDPFMTKICDKLNENKRIVVISNSRKFLRNTLEPILKEKNKKYLIVDRCTGQLTDLNNWDQYDVVAYTPTIVAGLSFEKQNVFDCRFCYFADTSAPADICTQMCFRVRQTVENKMYVCVMSYLWNENFPLDEESIERWLTKYVNLEFDSSYAKEYKKQAISDANLLNYNNFTRTYTKNAYYYILMDYFRKKFLSKCHFGNRLIYYLSVQGWEQKQYMMDETEIDHIEEVSETVKQLHAEELIRVEKAAIEEYRKLANPILSHAKYESYLFRRQRTREQKIKMNIYVLSTTFGINFQTISDGDLKKIVKYYEYFLFEKQYRESKFNDPISFAMSRAKGRANNTEEEFHSQYQRDFYMRSNYLLQLIKKLGFESWYDYNTEIEIDKKFFTKIQNYTYQNKSHFQELLRYNSKKNTTKADWGFKSLKQFVQKINPLLKKIGRRIKQVRPSKKDKGNATRKYKMECLISTDLSVKRATGD